MIIEELGKYGMMDKLNEWLDAINKWLGLVPQPKPIPVPVRRPPPDGNKK